MHRRESRNLPLRIVLRLKVLARRARDRAENKSPWGTRYKEAKDTVSNLFEDPFSGPCALIIVSSIAICIVASTTCFILESMPQYETPEAKRNFWTLEVFFVTVFTVEYLLRFWSTKEPRLRWMSQPLNVIDLIAIIPFYLTLALSPFKWVGFRLAWAEDWRILRIFRLLRMLKFSRWSSQLQFIGEGVMQSRLFLIMLLFMLVFFSLMFSTPLWLLERGAWSGEKSCYAREGETFWSGCSPFESVPLGMWWAITTLTTVGFGDAFALTPSGRAVNGLCMFAGIFCLAVPTTVLSVEFATSYHEHMKRVKQEKVMRQLSGRSREELALYSRVQQLEGIRKKIECEFQRAQVLARASAPRGAAARAEVEAALVSLKVLSDHVNNNCNGARCLARSVTSGLVS